MVSGGWIEEGRKGEAHGTVRFFKWLDGGEDDGREYGDGPVTENCLGLRVIELGARRPFSKCGDAAVHT